ncbi:hypothetical protein SBA4_3400019 [Candidatus Sulfopaludibacter sp. SbA4]|nr:hypothetical protein SBA4_3400019 [Candidatus Sulfopaludibacter sp. SbA4]
MSVRSIVVHRTKRRTLAPTSSVLTNHTFGCSIALTNSELFPQRDGQAHPRSVDLVAPHSRVSNGVLRINRVPAGMVVWFTEGSMRFNEMQQGLERFGAVQTIQSISPRVLNLFVSSRVLKEVRIETVVPELLKCDKAYRGEFLSEALLTEDYPESPGVRIVGEVRAASLRQGGRMLRIFRWRDSGSVRIIFEQAGCH